MVGARPLASAPTTRRALVVGGGIGGLAAAGMLERAGWQVLVRTRQHTAADADGGLFDDALGLWSPALSSLRAWFGAAPLAALQQEGCYVRAVDGYHDSRGRRLVGPSAPLGDGSGNRPSLLFVRRSLLLATLRGACGPRVSFCPDVPGSPGGWLAAAADGREGDDEPAFDLLIGADGVDSAVRTALLPHAGVPVDWGFTVYRGLAGGPGSASAESLLPDGRSYQAWGTRAHRFAAVPAGGGCVAWFLTARGPLPAEVATAAGARAFVRRTAHSEFAPCAASLVDATADAELGPPVRARAHAFSFLRGPPRVRAPGFSLASGRPGMRPGVALVGDAAQTLDPILAQGAGVAIEDAAELAACVGGWSRAEGGPTLAVLLERYATARAPRLRALGAVSLVADAAGQLSGAAAAARDVGLRALPSAIKSPAFEALLYLSLAPAPLAGRWRYEPPGPPPLYL
ncbi:hypothetical protein T492DRAFT_1147305 [Pavlovales sp. CCMP2436]|nr:hypothetical protein T492DRAFT_1147305 [Pavlovales sp. CCMP2436]